MLENKININFDNESSSERNIYNEHHSHHHSSHHHSHHHSSKRRKSRNSNSEKVKRFVKRNKYKIANVAIAVLFVSVLAVLGIVLDKKTNNNTLDTSNNGIVLETDAKIGIEIPFFKDDVVISGTAVKTFMAPDNTKSAVSIYKNYSASGRLDTGLPVSISYSLTSIPEGITVKNAEVYLSLNGDFKPSSVYSLGSDETSIDIYHLFVGTQYYYRVTLHLSDGSQTSADGSFKTADTPRVLSVDGVANLRDIGGWETVDGKTINQGLLYRSAELDGAVNSKYRITPNGVNTMITVLGIQTEMDLRHSSDNPNGINALGSSVEHIYYGAPMYNEAFSEKGKATMRKIFKDLADKDNYPVLLHCTHGMDRTGTVCYILEALLGVNESDLLKEYQLSALYHGDLWSENEMSEFIGQLKSYEGYTIQQKAENYLLSIGVTDDEISAIREIFLDK